MPRGKAVWNANGGFVSVLLTHLFYLFPFFYQPLFVLLGLSKPLKDDDDDDDDLPCTCRRLTNTREGSCYTSRTQVPAEL